MADQHTDENEITTDPDQIEQWAKDHDAVPVQEGEQLRLVPADALDETRGEQLDWSQFHERFEEQEYAVVHTSEAADPVPLEVLAHDEAYSRFDLDREAVEERLLSGDVVTGTITETTVVEHTITEQAQVESEVVDSQLVDQHVVDAELVARDCTACTATGTDAEDSEGADRYGSDYFVETGAGTETADQPLPLDLEAEIDESWSVTIEELEEFTVESRVTNVDVTDTDAVEDVDVATDVETQQLHEHLLGSDLFHTGFSERVVDADTHAIESEFGEDDTITTTLTQHRTIDRELAMQHRVIGSVSESERTGMQVIADELVESTMAEQGFEFGERTTEARTDAVETDRTRPTDDDAGKAVIGASEEKIGLVSTVEDGIAYVDPEPSVTERVMAKLGWGDVDEEDQVLDPDQIARITDDEVVLIGGE